MAQKPISTGVVVLLVLVGVFNLLALIGLLALSYYAKIENHPGVELSAKPGPEEAQLFLGPGDLAGLGLLPRSVSNARTPAPTVDLMKSRYHLEMVTRGNRVKVDQTLIFQKGSPALNKAVADFAAGLVIKAVPDKPGISHDRFSVGKQGALVDAWSKDGHCYYLNLLADDGGVMVQMQVYHPVGMPSHAALGTAVEAEFGRLEAYAAKHPRGADGPKLP